MTKYSIQARLVVEAENISAKITELEALDLVIANVMPIRAAPVNPIQA